ncbi:MAG: hypothetical protein AAFZ65_10720, partial [Planctomycetota bacterium]
VTLELGDRVLVLPTDHGGDLRIDALRSSPLTLHASSPLGFEHLGRSPSVTLEIGDPRTVELVLGSE